MREEEEEEEEEEERKTADLQANELELD